MTIKTTSSASLNIEALSKQFWEDGFLVLENFFDDSLMDQYHSLILEHFGNTPEFLHNEEFLNKSDTEVIPWFPQREGVEAFDTVEKHPMLQALTQAILGQGWNSQYSMVMFSKQGTKGQAWHQDCPPENRDHFNMNRLVYTMDVSPEIGGLTMVVKGSHKQGVLPASDRDETFENEVVLEPKKGMLVLLHGHTWHRVTPVVGDYRVSTNYRCAPKGTPDDITDICVYRNMRYQFSVSRVVEDRLAKAVS
ncbi:phytanoyl-CoA dioxygenase family protein [Marinibactrum halimedae]|uniref:Phytanoyl-CoA dioxygenase n=1 Tax=Marinibactrum halimedae TaxID=1444977 RepID=A0AA37T0E7_9GAMM|nr:phytanoyl-CoA dioxygenase family protein [Marinibactrum halimedae]MCD9461057.1 phytanoyl-CoA dioxygenase family protein [Marinibactrum halimedae]GLS24435.1 hypothetical protein GCM10007877_01460 [Marinibactrum halimedae]